MERGGWVGGCVVGWREEGRRGGVEVGCGAQRGERKGVEGAEGGEGMSDRQGGMRDKGRGKMSKESEGK